MLKVTLLYILIRGNLSSTVISTVTLEIHEGAYFSEDKPPQVKGEMTALCLAQKGRPRMKVIWIVEDLFFDSKFNTTEGDFTFTVWSMVTYRPRKSGNLTCLVEIDDLNITEVASIYYTLTDGGNIKPFFLSRSS